MIYGDEEQSQDFTYVANVVEANLLACKDEMGAFSGEVFNAATGKRATINELVANINKLLQTDIKPEYEAPRPGDVKHSLANIGKAMQFLGYKPDVGFFEGLKKITKNIS